MNHLLPKYKTPYSRIDSLFICPKFSIPSNPNTLFISKPTPVSWNFNFLTTPRLLPLYTSSSNETEPSLENLPLSVELQPISDESHFDRVIDEAQQAQESVLILWMASWCRKCIYLKPKLEKLAVDYYPRIRFYSVDVNNVPHRLVVRAGVTKMPTVQLWRDGQKEAEVIGGHKAYLVVNEIREMIEKEDNL